jgi:hypothetical protein
METGHSTEREICSEDKWYIMRSLPYQSELATSTNGIFSFFSYSHFFLRCGCHFFRYFEPQENRRAVA